MPGTCFPDTCGCRAPISRILPAYLEQTTPKALRPNSMNYWSNTPKFVASLLKAYYGAKATKRNDFGYDYLPKLGETDNYSWGYIFDKMYAGQMEGLISFGMNPVANGPNTPKMLAALSKLKWLIVADYFETETASFWKAKDLAEKYYATAPDADAHPDRSLPASCRLLRGEGRRVRELFALGAVEERRARPSGRGPSRSGDHCPSVPEDSRAVREGRRRRSPEPLLNMTWNWQNPLSPSLAEVAKEINGRDAAGKQLSTFGELTDDGSTVCGNWIYSGSFTEAGNMMARRGQDDPTGLGLFPNWAGTGRPTAASFITAHPPTPTASRGTNRARRFAGTARSGPATSPTTKPMLRRMQFGAFIMLPEGVAKLFAPDFVEGPFPEHYEPVESPVENVLHPKVGSNPAAKIFTSDLDKLGTAAEFPYVGTTYRLTEHFHYWTKHIAGPSELQPHFFVEVPEALATEKGIRSGDMVRVRSARGSVEGRAMVTKRMRGLTVAGKTVYQVGLPIHWGFIGRVTGPLINNLSPTVLDPNAGTPEYKGFLVNLEKI